MFCRIVIPSIDSYITPPFQELIRLHEIGHCLGWPKDHPGERWVTSPPKQDLHTQSPKLVWSPVPSREPSAAISPALAARVVLYEEDPTDRTGKRFAGSVLWRTETVTALSGRLPDLAIRAEIKVPERQLAMTISMRRNTNQALRATHVIEVGFSLPVDSPRGAHRVHGILMKQAGGRGTPLSGSAMMMTPTTFLLGLSVLERDAQRNLELLKEQPLLEIPVSYSNGRRAIIAVEKGTSGERAFAEAFGTWERIKPETHPPASATQPRAELPLTHSANPPVRVGGGN
jgi:hypothetical protein